jgi:hypothetical protein
MIEIKLSRLNGEGHCSDKVALVLKAARIGQVRGIKKKRPIAVKMI